jgi:outer membrane receptor protein involved in Fe transport
VRRFDSLAAAFLLLSVGSQAQAAQRHRLNLPAGRLGDAAVALGRQAGISIGVRDPDLARRRVGAVRGDFAVEDALRRMLRGTGAGFIRLGPDTYLIARAPPPPPGPVARRRAPPLPRPKPVLAVVPHRPAPLEPEEEAIVVTGSKRQVLLGAYAGSATLIDGDDPALEGVAGTEAVTERVPSVTSTHLGPGRNKLFIRGIADSSFNGPTQATVGQYLGETRLNYNAPDPDLKLYDVERVEVLAGPQGTLYGAGSLGGIIRVVPTPADPRGFEGALSLGGSAIQHGDLGADAAGMVNVPLIEDRLGVRLVAYGETEGGYIDDLERGEDDVNRTKTIGGRASLRAVSGNGWTVDLGVTGQRIRGADAQFADRDAPPLTRRSAVDQGFGNDYLLGDLVVSKRWGDLRLVSATGAVRQTLKERYDSTRADAVPTVFEQRNRITMLSSDTRLSLERPDGVGFVVGTSFVVNRSTQDRALGDPERPRPITGVRNSVWEATLYGEAAVKLFDPVTLTAGGRITHSELSGAALDAPLRLVAQLAAVSASRKQTSFLPSAALSARLSPELLLFLRYQEGFRPGGLAVSGDFIQRFQSDRVGTAEAGARFHRGGARGFDAAATLAYTRWSDIQADIVDFAGLPTTANIGDGRIYSLDLQLGWRPLPGLSFDASAVFSHSKVTNPAPSIIIATSSPLPNVARFNGRLGVEYRHRVSEAYDLRLTASARYVGKSRLGIGPILGEEQGDWLDTRLGARLESERHAFSITVTNALDEVGNRFALGSPFTLIERPQVTPLQPRTIRLGWETRF